MSISHDDIQSRIQGALQALKENHASLLLAENMSETGLTHYFTNALSQQFEGWDVDFDYNQQAIWPENSANSKKIYPDIIVHRRGNPSQRLLALEIKKWGCPPKMIKRDREKLTEYLQQMDYQHAAFVFLPCMEGFEKPESQMIFFHPPLKNQPTKKNTDKSDPVTVTSTKVVSAQENKSEKQTPTPKQEIKTAQPSSKTAQTAQPTQTPTQAQNSIPAPITNQHSVETSATTSQHQGDPQDQTSQSGIINEHLLSKPDPSPLIYPDQINFENAPRLPLPGYHNGFESAANHDQKPRAILKPLGLDIHQEDKPTSQPQKSVEVDHVDVEALKPKENPNNPYQSAPLHDFKDALQKMPKSLFPSRIYIEPTFWDEVKEPEDLMPQPQSKSEGKPQEPAKSYQQN